MYLFSYCGQWYFPSQLVLQFARWLSVHGAWRGKTYNNTTIVIPTILQHLWAKSSAPYFMHFDNQLANCNRH